MNTTPEWLDIYDENGVRLGRKEREAVHRDGDWHRTFDCWMVRAGPRPAVLFQKRAASKRDNPLRFDTTVAGHLLAGEPMAAGIREIQEELGLWIPFSALVPMGTRIAVARSATRIDREFQTVFITTWAGDRADLNLAPDEVAGVAWIDIDAGLNLFSGRQAHLGVEFWGADGSDTFLRLTPEAFSPCHDRYYTKVFWMAQRYLAGSADLAI